MKEQRIYRDLARYYDRLYHWKDYKKESSALQALIRQYKVSKGNFLLEVACGTGKHLSYFLKDYRCTGIDLNSGILREARKRLKGAQLKSADMTSFALQQHFDVILCLFSSIGYVKTIPTLRKTIQNFASHCAPGGIVIIEPWFTPETFRGDRPWMSTYDGDDCKIARVGFSKKSATKSDQEIHYIIAEKGKGVRHFVDRHIMGLFPTKVTLDLLRDAGFEAEFLKDGLMEGRGLFVAVKDRKK